MEDERTQKVHLPRTYRGRVSAAFEERTMAMLSPITRPDNLSDSSFTVLEKSLKMLDNDIRRTSKLTLSREAQLNRRSFRRQSILEEDATICVPVVSQQTSRLSEYQFTSDNTMAFPRHLPAARIPEEEMVLGGANPSILATDYLFREFLTASQERPAEHQTFHLLSVYEGMLTSQVDSLRNILKNAPQGHLKLESTSKLESFLRLERDTWRLVGSLYQDRMNTQDTDMEEDEEYLLADLEGSEASDKVVIQKLYERDASIRQMQVIVDWLERNAGDLYGDTFYDKVEYFNEPSAGWENTLRSLKNKSQGIGSTTDRNLVTELDPDAPFRQKKPLHDLDQEDEHRLLRCVFALLRCGQLEEAQLLCHRSGQSWRAAMFEGWRPYHDPNRETALPLGEKLPVEGNLYRDVWKAVAYAACTSSSPSLPLYEKAALGSFCGHLDAILPACESWEDALWANVKVAIDTRVEKKLRNHHQHSKGHTWEDRPLEELPADYWQHDCSLEQVVSSLAASSQYALRTASAHSFRVIQSHVILDDLDGMLETMASWTANGLRDLPDVDDVTYPHLLRAMAHIVLCFKQMGKLTKDEAAAAIMESYVKYVAEVPYLDLVASYVAHLPADMQVSIYAQFLGSLGPESETEADKKYCLTLADEAGLDVAAIAKSLVEFIRCLTDPEDANQNAPLKSTPLDDKKIASLDWLLIYPEHREEALAQAHAYVRYCVGVGKLEAAQTAFSKIPADSVGLIMTQWKAQTNSADLPASVQNTIKEHLCLKSYLEAQAFFNDWFTHFHHNKPSMPSTAADSKSEKGLGRAGAQVSFTEKLAREHREKQYQADINRWKAALSIITEKTVEKLYNVLLFPDGGWLVDPENTQDEERVRQLGLLRERCIPQVTNLLCTVLLSTEQWKECLRLADLVAAELPGLYKVFGPEELAHLLSNLGQAYVAVLDQDQQW